MKKHILTAVKGFIVGGTMLVPGVSGGSMAMILGIYDRLISSVSSFMKHKKESLIFLAVFLLGSGLGIATLAKPLLWLVENYTKPMMFFFMGAVAGGIPMIFREAQVKKPTWRVPIYIIIGLASVFLIALIPAGAFQPDTENLAVSLPLLALAGFIAAVALILPGISVSYMLLLLGLYDTSIRAVSELDFLFLLPLAAGLVAGILLTTGALEAAMKRFPQPTYLIILGFVLGSIVQVFPGIPSGWEILLCLALAAAGYAAIRLISSKR